MLEKSFGASDQSNRSRNADDDDDDDEEDEEDDEEQEDLMPKLVLATIAAVSEMYREESLVQCGTFYLIRTTRV